MVRNLIIAAVLAATAIAMPQGPGGPPPSGTPAGPPPSGTPNGPPPSGTPAGPPPSGTPNGPPPTGTPNGPPPTGTPNGPPPTGTPNGPPPPGPKPTTTTTVSLTGWGNVAKETCTPTYEEYVCDKEGGGEYTTTFGVYPTDCPDYTSWADWTPAAETSTPYNTWSAYADPTTSTWAAWSTFSSKDPWSPEPTAEPTWSAYDHGKGEEIITITFIATWVVPCSTGWETHTSTIYTTYDEYCTETPKPAKPTKPAYSTYTTTCPESWGVGKTVTVTVPYAQWTPDAASASSTWATWSSASSPDADSASTWATWSTYSTPAAVTASASWSGYSVSTPAAATATWSAIGVYHGAAVANGVSQIMVVAAGAVAALAFYL